MNIPSITMQPFHSLSFLTLLPVLLLLNEINCQVYDIDEPSGNDYYCTAGATSCNITVTGNCNSDICLYSSYHCPSGPGCQVCEIDCQDTKICKLSTLYSYSCSNVVVKTSSNAPNIYQEFTIHGPKGGDLQVSIHSREFSFYGVKIFSNETQNMNIDISRMMGDHVGGQMTIDASDATGRLSLTCEADCDESTIKCPTNSLSNNCNIDCSNANGNFKCKQMNIYAPEGWSSVDYSCDDSSICCAGSSIYCSDDSTLACSMSYDGTFSDWDCDSSGDNLNCGGTPDTNGGSTDTDTETNTNGGGTGNTGNNGGITTTRGDTNPDGGPAPSDESEENFEKNDSENGDLIIVISVAIVSIILFIVFLVFCVRYLYRHEEKWMWLWDWIIHACCKRHKHTIPEELPAAQIDVGIVNNGNTQSQHISPIFTDTSTTNDDHLDQPKNTLKLEDGHSNIRIKP